MKNNIKLYFLIVLVALFLLGCSRDTNSQDGQIGQTEEVDLTEDTEESAIVNQEYSYAPYLNKIWIMEDQTREYDQYFSFYITSIENGELEGIVKLDSVALPEYYSSYQDTLEVTIEEQYLYPQLSGLVEQEKAVCKFETSGKNEGTVTILFKQEDQIEVSIEFNGGNADALNERLKGTYQMRPYQLSDLPGEIVEEQCYEAELDYWGMVEIISTYVENSGEGWYYPAVYLADTKGNILYSFGGLSTPGTQIDHISVEDRNEDRLQDVCITSCFTCFRENPEIQEESRDIYLTYDFYQMSGGLFYRNTRNVIASEESAKEDGEAFCNKFVRKVWFMGDEPREYYQYFSFYITSVENGVIEGKIRLDYLALPSDHDSSLDDYSYFFDMAGYIDERKAVCEFLTRTGEEGFLTLEFGEDELLTASLAFNSRDPKFVEHYGGIHSMRPYHISDLPEKIEREHCFKTELDSWGTVEFITILFTNEEKGWWYPLVYLADLDGNVIYEFGLSDHGTRVYDIVVEDMNDDGLKDINIILIFNYPDKETKKTDSSIQYILYQSENGEFDIYDIIYENVY